MAEARSPCEAKSQPARRVTSATAGSASTAATLNDPKWRTISRWTRVQPAVVIAIVDCILDAAAGGKPRGSIAEFSHEECRSALELRTTGPVKKVVKALEKMGWIDREYLTKWDELQPDKEDQTAAERQQRRRAKIRQQNQAEFPPSRVTGFPPCGLDRHRSRHWPSCNGR